MQFGRRPTALDSHTLAQTLAEAFYRGYPAIPLAGRERYRLKGTRPFEGVLCDVLETAGESDDSHGIPSGRRWSKRFYLGHRDHLPRGRVETEAYERDGKRSTLRVVERMVRMEPNAAIPPSLFGFPTTGKEDGVSPHRSP